MLVAERLMVGKDAVKELVVGKVAPGGVLEEWIGDAVGGAEVPEQVIAALEQALEDAETIAHLGAAGRDELGVGSGALEFVLELVRRLLVDALEPVDEQVHLGAPGRV